MDEDTNKKYLERLTEMLASCLTVPPSGNHGLLIIAHDETESLSVYTINTSEEMLAPMVKSAATLVYQIDPDTPRTIN